MEYALLIYGDEKVWAAQTEDELRELAARHERFVRMLDERGAMRGGRELAPVSAATTLRRRGEDVSVTDGPFAETAEVLGGFYLIEAADLDEAMELAARMPEGVVEIRPVVPVRESAG
ncbi:YciI family protein [Nonomuraea sp. NPDC050783]|uniref:YciI family protein n=1 Tax=Nonomuraea sp. NPDC050783 TaxID=3154634 RepID=UPI003466BC86